MKGLEKQYKAIPLEERIAMSLAEEIPEQWRPFVICDQWLVVKCYFSRRADLRPEEVAVLATDDDYVIRLSIAKREDLTSEMVQAFVRDRDPNVRHAIARNRLLPEAQRQQLETDVDELVMLAARKGPREIRFRQRPGQAVLIR